MLFEHLFCLFYIFYYFQISAQASSIIKNERDRHPTFEKFITSNRVQPIKITIETKFKEGISQLNESLSGLLKSEFASKEQKLVIQEEKMSDMQKKLTQQDEQLAHLLEIVNAQSEKLNNLSQNFNQKNCHAENFTKIDLQMQTQNFQEFFKTQLNPICEREFLKQNQNLTELITTNMVNQEKVMEKLFKESVCQSTKVDPNQWDSNFNCTNSCGPIMDLPSSCEEAVPSRFCKDGVYLIKIKNSELKPFYAYCKRIDNKVWTIIQRREDGSVDFFRNWTEYRNGFGNLYGEFWLGLERLHAMTKQHDHELHIWLMAQNGSEAYAQYDKFLIDSEAEKYKLTVGVYQGNATDDLNVTSNAKGTHNGMKFSTYDECNDNHKSGCSCAVGFGGAWWFDACYYSHLNGPYFSTSGLGVDWNGFDLKLKYAQMAIRRV